MVIHDKDDPRLPSFWMMGSKVFSITLILGSTTLVIILVAEKAEKMEKSKQLCHQNSFLNGAGRSTGYMERRAERNRDNLVHVGNPGSTGCPFSWLPNVKCGTTPMTASVVAELCNSYPMVAIDQWKLMLRAICFLTKGIQFIACPI